MGIGFITCGPNEALVISGCGHNKPLLLQGGRVFVWSKIHLVQRIQLNIMTLKVSSQKVYTLQGVPINVTGAAQLKVQGQHMEMLMNACEQLLGKTRAQIQQIALETLEGHQRAIIGTMSVEEIYKDRKKFNENVLKVASTDFINMGLTVLSYTLTDIHDDDGYLQALGMSRASEVKRDARIGEAEANKDSTIQKAIAEEQTMAAKYQNDTEIAKAQRDFELKKASYDMEVNAKQAEAELAYDLQSSKTRQIIKEEQMQIKVVERAQAIQVQEQEVKRRERELEATVKQPADAEKYKLEKLAEASRIRTVLEAEAEAEAKRMKGEAEAFAIQAKAKAEAVAMQMKADAYKEYKEAAMIEMFLRTLPKVAAEVAGPLSMTKKMTMVSSGQSDIGAAKLTGEVMDIITKVPDMVKTMTGVDIAKSLQAASIHI
ncbi:unnamed protein product, partial [Meganyctiphanes norvegica]